VDRCERVAGAARVGVSSIPSVAGPGDPYRDYFLSVALAVAVTAVRRALPLLTHVERGPIVTKKSARLA
jgi:hypothetical protein